jgi:hypothetical protein
MNKLLLLSALCAASAFGEEIMCRVMLVDLTPADESPVDECKQIYECEPHDSDSPYMVYALDFPDHFLDMHNDALELGDAIVSISEGEIVNDPPRISYASKATFNLIPEHEYEHRQLHHNSYPYKVEGISKVLVVRVTALDSAPAVSHALLAGRIFGIGDHNPGVNVVSQIGNCSFSKLQLVPAQGQDIMHGIGEITIPWNATDTSVRDMENKLTTLTEQKFGAISGNFDHIIYCIPPGTRYDTNRAEWLGYAYIRSWRSYFNGDFCGGLSGTIHELGHNLNLRHSNEGRVAYGDTTGYMGGASLEVGGPASCFNSNKNWFLGWYKDKSTEVDYTRPWGGHLYSFVDYENVPEGGWIVIKIKYVYLQWNRAKGFNSGTRKYRNEVPVVYNPGSGYYSVLDNSIGTAYGNKRSVTFRGFDHTPYDLVIEACDTVYGSLDSVRISIHLSIHESTCNKNLNSSAPSNSPTSPSSMPTPTPSYTKTFPPSSTPTLMEHVSSPSYLPTSMPSSLPTSTPSSLPTNIPSFLPSNTPSSLPTSKPSYLPTSKPSYLPTSTPSYLPTSKPSYLPTSTPSYLPTSTPSDITDVLGKLLPYQMCEDQRGSFWVEQSKKDQLVTCSQLGINPDMMETVCRRNHAAFYVCPETCKKCTDNCNDSDGDFFVNQKWGRQQCSFLATKPGFRNFVCRPGFDAYTLCGETCNSCGDSDAALILTTVPAAVCSDSRESIFINRYIGHRKCGWLTHNPAFASFMCSPEFDVFHKCRYTCNSCDATPPPSSLPSTFPTGAQSSATTDTICSDSTNEIFVSKIVGYQTCDWIVQNPAFRGYLCRPGFDAFNECRETCKSCDDSNFRRTEEESLSLRLTCEDSIEPEALVIEELEGPSRDCAWLGNNPDWQADLCLSDHGAWAICPEICGACTDNCDDDPVATFEFGEAGFRGNCQWLSLRPEQAEQYCVELHPANEVCRETCGTC